MAALVLVLVLVLVLFWVHSEKLVALMCRSARLNATGTPFGTQNGQKSRAKRLLAAACRPHKPPSGRISGL